MKFFAISAVKFSFLERKLKISKLNIILCQENYPFRNDRKNSEICFRETYVDIQKKKQYFPQTLAILSLNSPIERTEPKLLFVENYSAVKLVD